MIYLEWKKVYELVSLYGYEGPCLDVGGYLHTTMADYNNDSGVGQHSVRMPSDDHIWAGFADEVEVSHDLKEVAVSGRRFGTIISTSTLEHVEDPRQFFNHAIISLNIGGLMVLSTVFIWPEHGDPGTDFWRFTPSGLKILAENAYLKILDAGYLEISPARVVSWIAVSRDELSANRQKGFPIPQVVPE